MFLVSMPLLCEPNDAVRAVAVAKRREYESQLGLLFPNILNIWKVIKVYKSHVPNHQPAIVSLGGV